MAPTNRLKETKWKALPDFRYDVQEIKKLNGINLKIIWRYFESQNWHINFEFFCWSRRSEKRNSHWDGDSEHVVRSRSKLSTSALLFSSSEHLGNELVCLLLGSCL